MKFPHPAADSLRGRGKYFPHSAKPNRKRFSERPVVTSPRVLVGKHFVRLANGSKSTRVRISGAVGMVESGESPIGLMNLVVRTGSGQT
jgi:hypothetical protein